MIDKPSLQNPQTGGWLGRQKNRRGSSAQSPVHAMPLGTSARSRWLVRSFVRRKLLVNPRLKRAGGFSLLELLVVMALIGILTAILAPTYSSIKKKTKTMQCMNNMKQVGTSMMLYAADQGGFPYAHHHNYWCDWGEHLIPYLEGPDFRTTWVPSTWNMAYGLLRKEGSGNPGQHFAHEVGQGTKNKNDGTIIFPGYPYFTCPETPPSRALTPPWDGTTVHVYAHSYSCNEYLMPSNHSGNYVNGRLIPKVKPENLERPGSLILICDSGISSGDAEASDTLWGPLTDGGNSIVWKFITDPSGESANGYQPLPTPAVKDNDLGGGLGWPVYSRHRGTCHALMADGHVSGATSFPRARPRTGSIRITTSKPITLNSAPDLPHGPPGSASGAPQGWWRCGSEIAQ
jgi:prepilin-type N-terminal cleavage/methylation domain-containing protein/prepilin-type processing-associated H-X9-DG protein